MNKHPLAFFWGLSLISTPLCAEETSLNFIKIFKDSPIIYSVLILIAAAAMIICLYSLFTLKISGMIPGHFIREIRDQFLAKNFDAALATCQQQKNFSAHIIACGIGSRKHGPEVIVKAMQAESKRQSAALWQRIALLNKIAVLASLLGFLGSITAWLYAFYDVSRSQAHFSSIFDHLDSLMGTAVFGVGITILTFICHKILKYRLAKILGNIENEAISLGSLLEPDFPKASSLD